MLGWTHSGFSLDMSVKIPAGCSRTREALAHYIARPPVSLSKMLVEEHEASVLYRSGITDPPEVRRILLHLIKTGVAPPGVEASLPN
ncbi:MAG: hypothetical protein ABSG21_11860 [Spirochaetia bacterium]|jgi:hypothetical protein